MNAITTVKEGKDRLAGLEASVSTNLHASKQAFSEAMLALEIIRDENLWMYHVDDDGVMVQDYKDPQFKRDYLLPFCRNVGISMSGVYGHLGTVRAAREIGWDNDTIMQVGVREANPLKQLVDVNAKTNEIRLPPPEVIERLPPGDTPIDRIRAKADEIFIYPAEPLSPADVIRSIVHDVRGEPEVSFFQSGEGDVWFTWSHDDDQWDGKIIPAKLYGEIAEDARAWLVKKLGIREY